jgi:hypothetical protein
MLVISTLRPEYVNIGLLTQKAHVMLGGKLHHVELLPTTVNFVNSFGPSASINHHTNVLVNVYIKTA